MKYMTEILARELHQAVNVNNENFRFKQTDEAGIAEEYLAKVEGSSIRSIGRYGNSDKIRKKIAAVFEPNVAYKILTSCYFPEEPLEGKYQIKHRLPLELSSSQQELLYSQVLAVFGDRVESIEIIESFKVTTNKPVVKPQYSSTFKEQQALGSFRSLGTLEHTFELKEQQTISTYIDYIDTQTIWGRVRSSLINLYGDAIDKSWFSKLEITEDQSSHSLSLKGANFLTSYIQTNYAHAIERLCKIEGYEFKFC